MNLPDAIRVLVTDECLGDWVYDVRERALSDDESYEGSSWDHPRVQRFSEACKALEDWLAAHDRADA